MTNKRKAAATSAPVAKKARVSQRTERLQEAYFNLVKNLQSLRTMKTRIASKYNEHKDAQSPEVKVCYETLECIVEKLKNVIKGKGPATFDEANMAHSYGASRPNPN